MLFLVFQVGRERYALEAGKVVEVLPLIKIKRLPHAPRAVAGVFIYRGSPVPAVDLTELTLGQPAAELLSTRIIVVDYTSPDGRTHQLGLVAENATELIRKEPHDFLSSGIMIKAAPYLGPVLMDPKGPIQWLHEQHLLSEPVQQLLFGSPTLLDSASATSA